MPFHEFSPAPSTTHSAAPPALSPAASFLGTCLVGAILILVGNGLLSFWNIRQVTENDRWVSHTHEVRVHLKEVLPTVRAAESALRSWQVPGNDASLKTYDDALPRLRTELATLEFLVQDNGEQLKRLVRLRQLLEETFPALFDPDAAPRGEAFQKSLADIAAGRSQQRLARMVELLNEMDQEEVSLLEKRAVSAEHSTRLFYATLGVSTSLGIALLALVSSLTLRDARGRQRHAETLARAVRRKEEALALLDTLLDTAPVGLAFVDREFRFVRINDTLAAMNGLPGTEHAGRRVAEVVPQLWPTIEPIYRSVLKTGQPVLGMELSGETAGAPGELRHWLVSYYPVFLGGETVLGIGVVVVEVTDRKRAEEALRHSEQQWRHLADAMPQIVWTARPDGYVDYYNRRWYEYTGFAEGEGGDDSWKPILHPDDVQLALATWYHSIRTGEVYQIEYRFRDRRTGGFRWHLGRALPVRDDAGRIVRWYGTSTDIDDQKRAEAEVRSFNESLEQRVLERTEQLATSNQRLEEENRERRRAEEERGRLADEFRLLLDSSGEGIYGIDSAGRCTFINRVAAELLGGAPEDFYGHDMHALVHHTRADGSHYAHHDCPIDQAYRVGFACRCSDDVFWRLDSGNCFPVEYSSRPLLAGGQPCGAVVTFTNITERQRQVRELREAKEAAEAANQAKSEFLANMSHEIRTPMNGILGMTELALDTDLRPEQREFLDTVRTSAEALLTLVNDILDFSKIEAGKLDLDPRPFRLREALDDMLKPLAMRARSKGLELACQVQPEIPDALVGDWGRARQILINLVGNALKFTERGAVVVRVALDDTEQMDKGTRGQGNKETKTGTADDPGSDCLVPLSSCSLVPLSSGITLSSGVSLSFQVIDTGIGIATEKLGMIFDPFVQADGSMARQYGGTGLGLAISSRLTRLLGGRLWAESEPNKGSTFHFVVQLAPDTDQNRDLLAEAIHTTPAEPVLPPLRILLVEDNRVNQRFGVALLAKRGHSVEVAVNGRHALGALAERSFDLVLMDVQMPEMDGLEATLRIRERELGTERRTPIIALTAHAMKGDRERCLAAGMDGYVSKPLQTAELLRAIRDVLECTAIT